MQLSGSLFDITNYLLIKISMLKGWGGKKRKVVVKGVGMTPPKCTPVVSIILIFLLHSFSLCTLSFSLYFSLLPPVLRSSKDIGGVAVYGGRAFP